jgi:hypothetical protein
MSRETQVLQYSGLDPNLMENSEYRNFKDAVPCLAKAQRDFAKFAIDDWHKLADVLHGDVHAYLLAEKS